MNRKELGCAVVGAVLGAAGCSPAVKSFAVPAAGAEESAANDSAAKNAPHISEVVISLISGTEQDVGSALVYLEPHSGWSISSNDDRLQVSIDRGHVATLVAPADKKVNFIAKVTIMHVDGLHLNVRCHVEAGCPS